MVTAVLQHQEREVQCQHQDGSRYVSVRAQNRNMHWREVCAELIDNANMAGRNGETANVVIEWGGKGRDGWFSVYDDGIGSSDLQPFFSCGVSHGRDLDRGSSTFGQGLFGVECVIDGQMTVATVRDGIINAARRAVREKESGFTATIEGGEALSLYRKCGLPAPRGTLIWFQHYAKAQPQQRTVEKLSAELSRTYGGAISTGMLAITLKYRGTTFSVSPPTDISLLKPYSATFEIAGHQYTVRWGVTADVNRDNGVRLMYGGKLCDTTRSPCGNYAMDRFFAELTIPRSIGEQAMDLFKRGVDDELLQPVYEHLATLFNDCLVEADSKSQFTKYQSLNERIRQFLCGAKPRDTGGDDVGDKETRRFNGRDPDGKGVEPVNSGRKRHGKGGVKKRNDSLDVDWLALGDDRPLCEYKHNSSVLTFNADIPHLAALRDSSNDMAVFALAAIGAGYMAFSLKSHEGYGDYDYQFKKNMRSWPSTTT